MAAIPRITLLSLAHFALALLIGVIAFGTDMDQLASRSIWSRAASVIHDILWFPHDTFMRSLPNGALVQYPAVIPAAIVLNSLLWGVVLYALWRAVEKFRQRQPG